jgi:uncharacterized protein YjeT (DUF2065 family)
MALNLLRLNGFHSVADALGVFIDGVAHLLVPRRWREKAAQQSAPG